MEASSPDGSKDVSFSNDFDQIFQLDPLSNDCGDLSPSVPTSQRPRQPPQELLPLQQDAVYPANHHSFASQETLHPAGISDFTFKAAAAPRVSEAQRPSSTSPSTPPATPRRKRGSKGALVTPKTIRHRESHDHRQFSRKQSFSPSSMRSSQMPDNRMAYTDAWAPRFQNYNLQSSNGRLPLSPPPSDILVQHENMHSGDSAHMNRSAHSPEVPQYDSNMFNRSPPVSMPSPSVGALARQQQRYMATSSPPPGDGVFSSHSSAPQSMSSWQSESMGPSAFSYPPDFHSDDSQAWWSPMSSRVPQRQPSYQSMVGSSAPQSPFQNPAAQNDMLQGGLMIQFDPSYNVPTSAESSYPSMPTTQENHHLNTVTAPATPQKFVNASSFTTPQVIDPQPQPTPSPPLSPKASGSPKRTSSPTKTPHRRGHTRKQSSMSSNGPKPVKAAGRSSASPKNSDKSISVSFVNFTAGDSRKILSGVAPSGSSKTKARREQEAKDRRRKLSEAALDAVRTAGGDVEALEAVLC